MKKVLIAHQSTIPHYRVPFYNALEHQRPDSWWFDVVFDSFELEARRFFKEPVDSKDFKFPTLETNTVSVKVSTKRIAYQTFWLRAVEYDLIIVGSALNNLTYPLCQFYQTTGIRFAYWGHGADRNIVKPSLPKFLMEKLRVLLARKADGFFAYTAGVKRYLERQGLSSHKIFVVNNTIDVNQQRMVFDRWRARREQVRQELGVQGKKVLLFVGRFTENKRIDFLLESFAVLQKEDASFHLLLVGSGGESYLDGQASNVSYLGSIVDLDKLGPIYVASDVYVFPGAVGLGPLQALCYDLPVITIDSDTHMPEFEYLSSANSIVLKSSTTPMEYAQTVVDLFCDSECLGELKTSIWPSINHLTIEQMAQNFIVGVNTVLDL